MTHSNKQERAGFSKGMAEIVYRWKKAKELKLPITHFSFTDSKKLPL